MANQYQHLLTAIDVGSAKTCALVAEITDSGLRYRGRSEEHTSELQSRLHLVCRLLLEKKKRTVCSGRGKRTRSCSSRPYLASPPSTASPWSVMYPAPSESRIPPASATSSGVPTRHFGT